MAVGGLSKSGCYCKAVEERGRSGQTGLVVEELLRAAQQLLVEIVQSVPGRLGCVMMLLTQGDSYGFFQRDVKTKRWVIISPF